MKISGKGNELMYNPNEMDNTLNEEHNNTQEMHPETDAASVEQANFENTEGSMLDPSVFLLKLQIPFQRNKLPNRPIRNNPKHRLIRPLTPILQTAIPIIKPIPMASSRTTHTTNRRGIHPTLLTVGIPAAPMDKTITASAKAR